MGTVTTSSATAFTHPAETIYDFVTNPSNWTKTYPGSAHVGDLPEVPLKVGDTWVEAGPDGSRIFTWHCAIAIRPRMFVFNSVGRLGHDADGNGGREGRMTITYQFTEPGEGVTLFTRSMTIETYKHAPFPDGWFRTVNPAHIDSYHEAIARELDALAGAGRA